MKKEFNKIYTKLYAEYIFEGDFSPKQLLPINEVALVKIIRKSINMADIENTLRPDAKYFLLVNFHFLIVKPLLEQKLNQEFHGESEFPEIENDIQADIATIVSLTKNEYKQAKISGHQIMRTIDRSWKNLRTTRLELWG